jgi:glycerol kinase
MPTYVVALDQGTTSSRAIVFDRQGGVVASQAHEFSQNFPQPGWVEHDPEEIWRTQLRALRGALDAAGIGAAEVAALGITNQRETTVVWDRRSGDPIYNAIVWQSRQTAPLCQELVDRGLEPLFRERTGLVVDAYFSATKIRWILDHVPGARERARRAELAFGTIDTWLIHRLTGGALHVTEYSNASRTLLYDIHQLRWDPELLQALEIPGSLLPEVRDSSGAFGVTAPGVLPTGSAAIRGVAGDQQAALFGQACFEPGSIKNTYGTGCFALMNTGRQPRRSDSGLLTTIAWGLGGEVSYALEGSVFVAGAAIQWLRDQLGLLRSAAESEELARSVQDTGGVYLVPAFAGLGAPYWDSAARGALIGLTRGTGRAHVVRAALESIAYQTVDVLRCFERDAGLRAEALQVDGGAAANDFLMQFQADIAGIPVRRPRVLETTALGAAYLAGLAAGYWSGLDDIRRNWREERRFEPALDGAARERLYAGWQRAVARTRG